MPFMTLTTATQSPSMRSRILVQTDSLNYFVAARTEQLGETILHFHAERTQPVLQPVAELAQHCPAFAIAKLHDSAGRNEFDNLDCCLNLSRIATILPDQGPNNNLCVVQFADGTRIFLKDLPDALQ